MAPLTISTSAVGGDVNVSVPPSFGPTMVAAAVAAAASATSESEPSSPTTPAPSTSTTDSAVAGDEGGITLKTILVLIFMFFLFAAIVVAFFLVARSSRNGQPRVPSSPRSQTSSMRRILPSAAGRGWGTASRSQSDMGLGFIGCAGRSPAMRSAPTASLPYIQDMHRSSTGSLRTLQGYDNGLGLTLSHYPDGEANAVDDAHGSVHSGSAQFKSNFDASAVTLVSSGHLQPPAYPENTAIPVHARARPVQSTASVQ